MKNLM